MWGRRFMCENDWRGCSSEMTSGILHALMAQHPKRPRGTMQIRVGHGTRPACTYSARPKQPCRPLGPLTQDVALGAERALWAVALVRARAETEAVGAVYGCGQHADGTLGELGHEPKPERLRNGGMRD